MFGRLVAAGAGHQIDIPNCGQRTVELNAINSSRTLGSNRGLQTVASECAKPPTSEVVGAALIACISAT